MPGSRKIGFIGLGRMGKWMASNLMKGGFDLGVFDINQKAMVLLAKQGAVRTGSAAELAKRVDVILLSLPNSDVVEAVVCGQDGILQGARPGQILVDFCGRAGYRARAKGQRCHAHHNVWWPTSCAARYSTAAGGHGTPDHSHGRCRLRSACQDDQQYFV